MGYEPPAAKHTHRKLWEWAAISQALWERDALERGKRGLGFACGTEPVVSMYAALGPTVAATDLHAGDAADFWKGSAEYAVSRDALFRANMIDREAFDRQVSFYTADMNDLGQFERGAYDFIWSSCAIEHVGSFDKAKAFLENAMDLLKPGGVSVHTTEINISSLDTLFDDGNIVLFRDQDLRRIDRDLRLNRGCIETLDVDPGSEALDVAYSAAPTMQERM